MEKEMMKEGKLVVLEKRERERMEEKKIPKGTKARERINSSCSTHSIQFNQFKPFTRVSLLSFFFRLIRREPTETRRKGKERMRRRKKKRRETGKKEGLVVKMKISFIIIPHLIQLSFRERERGRERKRNREE